MPSRPTTSILDTNGRLVGQLLVDDTGKITVEHFTFSGQGHSTDNSLFTSSQGAGINNVPFDLTSLTDGQVLTYSSQSGKISLKPSTATGGGGFVRAEYTFNAGQPPPQSGQVRLNNVNQPQATVFTLTKTDVTGVDNGLLLTAVSTGDDVFIQDKDNSASYQHYKVTQTPTD